MAHSEVVALVGEPGIGKTALLDYAIDHSEGMRVLQARGIESESVVPFGGLLQVLRPALGLLERIPTPQAEALAAAFALQPSPMQGRFAVGAATLSLLTTYAENGPVLVVVDDVHWLDESSAEALLFAIRRLVADPIAVILTARDDQPSLLDNSDVPKMRLSGIDQVAAEELLAHKDPTGISPSLVERMHRLTGGNPLALLEIGPQASLGDMPDERWLSVTTRTAQSFLGRSRPLSDRTRRMLVLAAAGNSADPGTLARAALLLGLDFADLTSAERVGLVTLDSGTVTFRHPLARSTIYREADPTWRRRAHEALAEALPATDLDRRAWHLAAAATGPNADVSAALAQTAERARDRNAFAESADAFERAGRLSPDHVLRTQLLYEAADTAWLAGLSDRSSAIAEEALGQVTDPSVAARIGHLRGHLAMRQGPVMTGYAILVEAAEAAAANGETELSVGMLAEAANACFYAGNSTELTKIATKAAALVPDLPDARTEFLAMTIGGMASVINGGGTEGPSMIRCAVDLFESTSQFEGDVRLLAWAVMCALWVRNVETGSAIIDRAIDTARQQVAIGTLPYLLHHLARHQATSDQWSAATGNYHEAIRLARETHQRTDLAAGLAGLAWLEARQGMTECRVHATEARELSNELGTAIYDLWAIAALADFELGAGNTASALGYLLEFERASRSLGIHDADLSPAPELIEVYLRLGNRDAAAEAAQQFYRRATFKGQPWALARAARSRGMLASDDQFEPPFLAALELHSQTPDAFETARTRLIFGARLRRARQRLRSRQELRIAIDLFDRMGATPWVHQATAELGATGETARRRNVTTIDRLTPQERQIALLLAGGSTTREAASALFLSPKTVEYHLRHVYQKLSIHSRPELAAEMARRR
jgi:DNA-binding CsgD family transcriptional regulator